MLTATVIVATHKKYRMPDDPLYLPMLVGAAGNDTDCEYAKDDFIKAEECDGHDLCKNRVEGGISEKNSTFCELTGLYAAWKNLDTDYIGLAHYRRHFLSVRYRGFFNKRRLKSEKDRFSAVLKEKELKTFAGDKSICSGKKKLLY